MVYLINGNITFNPENGSLTNLNNGRETVLSSLNAHILHLLIVAGSNCLRRDELLKKVWQDRGLTPSPATLNQYISVTRRALVAIGLQERLIITVAKTGYRLNNSISIIPYLNEILPQTPLQEPDKELENQSVGTRTIALSAPALPQRHKSVKVNTATYKFVFALMLMSILLISLLLINTRYQELNKTTNVNYIGNIKNCPVYFIQHLREQDKEAYLKRLADEPFLENGCKKGEHILAHTSRSLNITKGAGHQFIAKCSIDAKGRYYHCENEYNTLWYAG